jgi:hypothetical protein
VSVDKEQLQDLIQADLDGALSATERSELARLLLQNPEARRLHEEFRKVDQWLREIPAADPPAGLRADIISGQTGSARPGDRLDRRYGWPMYRMAAAIVAGLLIVGLGYFLLDANVPRTDLQGSVRARGPSPEAGFGAAQDRLSLRAEGVDVSASLRRAGAGLRLELDVTTTTPCEVIAKIDRATQTFGGGPGETQSGGADEEATVRLDSGSEVFVLDFAGVAPISLQLRSGGRLLAEGRLSVSDG